MRYPLWRVCVALVCLTLLSGCGIVGRSGARRETNISGVVSLPLPNELQCNGPGVDAQRQCAIWGLQLSHLSNPYTLEAGTSFAAPYVSAAAGMLVAQGLPAHLVTERLISTARPLGGGAGAPYGAGLLDVAAALGAANRPELSVTAALQAMQSGNSRRAVVMPSKPLDIMPDHATFRLYLRTTPDKEVALRAELARRKYTVDTRGSVWVIEGERELEDLAQELRKKGLVDQAVVSRSWQKFSGPTNDPYSGQQWALAYSAFIDAWDLAPRLDDVTIAVLDTGVDFNHPDLAGVEWESPCSLVDDIRPNGLLPPIYAATMLSPAEALKTYSADSFCWNPTPQDREGHGTMVTGVIAAVRGNGKGVSGAGFGAGGSGFKIMPVRVLDSNGYGEEITIAYGIYYAVAKGADVINLSLGGEPGGSAIPEVWAAIEYARQNGVVVVAAAGNHGFARVSPPANIPYVISVGAVNIWGMPTNYTNYGTELDISAPGGGSFTAMVLASATSPDTGVIDVHAYGITKGQGTFTLPPQPVGQYSFYYAWIDQDLNGRLNSGDYYDIVGPYQARQGLPALLNLQLRLYKGPDLQVLWRK